MDKRHSGMFKPGQSGNPSGRPKADKTIRDMARAHTDIALKTLLEIAQDPNAPKMARIQASVALLDRGWGKPVQYSENESKIEATFNEPSEAFRYELEERIKLISEMSKTCREEDQSLLQACLR